MKLRAATKHFMYRKPDGGIVIKATHCIECLHKRRWQLLGDDNGILKFDTREARDAHLAAMNADIANKCIREL